MSGPSTPKYAEDESDEVMELVSEATLVLESSQASHRTNRPHRTRSTIGWRDGSQTLRGQHTTAPPPHSSSQPCLCHSEESRCAYNGTASVSISWSVGGVPIRLQRQEFGRFPCRSVGTNVITRVPALSDATGPKHVMVSTPVLSLEVTDAFVQREG